MRAIAHSDQMQDRIPWPHVHPTGYIHSKLLHSQPATLPLMCSCWRCTEGSKWWQPRCYQGQG